MIANPKPGLLFGSLELADDLTGWHPDFEIHTLADDATWGNPQPIEVAVKSLLQDGSIVATTGHDNREAFIRLTLKASDGIGLALAEQAVNAEVGRLNTLTWTPPDSFGPPTVFEVVTSSLEHTFDDMDELRLQRTYGLRLVCQPFARSVDETTATALAAAESFGTARQLRRRFEVGGSARTQAAIEVAGTAALGWSLVYTGHGESKGAIPLRPHLKSAPTTATADASLLSGAFNGTTEGKITYSLPIADVEPGTYLMSAMMKSSASRTSEKFFVGSTSIVPGSGYVSDVVGSEQFEVYLNLGTAYTPTPLALLNLPPARLTGTAGTVEVYIQRTGTTIDWQLDDAWLFNVDTGAVTIVNLRSQRMWINPPTVESGVPSIVAGNFADGSDSFDLYRTRVQAWGAHTFPPGPLTVFTATAGATDADTTLRYFKRWHTHAAD
jgi:hypothetical protein